MCVCACVWFTDCSLSQNNNVLEKLVDTGNDRTVLVLRSNMES